MITFAREPVLSVREEMLSLLDSHYEELTLNKQYVKLNPNWFEYDHLERNGQFVLFTARDDKTLIGYSAFFLKCHIHYCDLLVASNDVIFLKKEYRLGMTGIKLIKYSEKMMRDMGAHKITWHVKKSNDFTNILYRMDYKDEDIIVGKIL